MTDADKRTELRFGLLGPLEVHVGGRRIEFRSGKQRALLALLLLTPGQPVSRDRVIDALWGERPPPTAEKMVHVFVSRLRRALGADAIATSTGGYALLVPAGSLDAAVFDELVSRAEHEMPRDPVASEAGFRHALALWRGRPLEDVDEHVFVGDRARLEEKRAALVEQTADAALAAGGHARIVGDLEQWIVEYPLRERLHGQLMLALYRSGRQAEALSAYSTARSTLVEGLGIEPSRALQELQKQILRQDAALDPPSPAETAAEAELHMRSRPARRGRLAAALVAAATAIAAGILAARLVGGGADRPIVAEAHSLAAFDVESGSLVRDAALPAQPGELTSADGVVWVGLAGDTVEARDLRGGLLGTYGLPAVATDIAAVGDSAWVAVGYTGTLSRIVERPGFVSGAFRPEPGARGRLLVTAHGGRLWVALQDGTILALDAQTRRVEKMVHGGRFPTSVVVNGRYLWEALPGSHAVVRIDTQSGARSTVALGATRVAVGDGSAWVLGDERLWRLDRRSLSIAATVPTPGGASIAVAPTAVWVASGARGLLYEIDPRTNELVRVKRLGRPISAIAVTGRRLLVAVQ